MRIKEYYDDFISLPKAVKYGVLFLIGGLALFCLFQSASNSIANKKVENLEKKNGELNINAAQSETRAKAAEENAVNEAANRARLENKLKSLEKEIKTSDEKIISQSKKSTSLRDNISRVRVSRPRNISTVELEKRICARYGNCQENGY